jgi:predicted phosphodiesterase
VSKGPWVLAVDEEHATVRYESCEPTSAEVTFTPETGGPEITAQATESTHEITSNYGGLLPETPHDLPGIWRIHEVTLGGLAPSTCYRYRVAGSADHGGRFCTARRSGESFRFAALADTNPGLNDSTKQLLEQLIPEKADFTLHAGDVQYYAGGLETYASWFVTMQPLLGSGAFFPAVGNHESEKPDEYDGYFRRFWGNAGFDGQGGYYRLRSGGVWFFALDTEHSILPGSEQGTWLLSALDDATKQPGFRFSIVYMHRPMLTCGDTNQLDEERQQLAPEFLERGVKLVLAGHMHGYERFEVDGLTYVVSGGGGGLIDNVNANQSRPLCSDRVASGAFFQAMVFDVAAGKLSGRALGSDGTVRDSFSLDVP